MHASSPNRLGQNVERVHEGERSRVRRRLGSLGIVLLCLYAPFSWLLFIDYPRSAYRWYWLAMWPVLPGFLAGVKFHSSEPLELTVMGLATAVAIGLLTYVGTLGVWGRVASIVLALAISVPTAMMSYLVFRS